jgi:hypothetical protein
MNREILQQALDALIYHRDQTRPIERSDAAITALREALAAPEPEPVARVAEVHMSRYTIEWTNGPLPEGTGLYAAPPAAPAPVVPLTDGRITAIANELAFGGGHCNVYELARAIEKAHGIGGGNG